MAPTPPSPPSAPPALPAATLSPPSAPPALPPATLSSDASPSYVHLAQESLRLFVGLCEGDRLDPAVLPAAAFVPSDHLVFPCASLVQKILLCQPLRRRLFSLSFLPYGPAVHAQSPPSVPHSCKPLSDVLLLHHSVGLKFENAAWTRLKSFTTVPSAPAPPSCPLTVTFFQFPLPISPVLCDLILHCLFGGNPRQFHSAVVAEDEFSCVVANRGVADLILSFGDLRRPGIDVRFSLPEQRSPAPPAATLVPAPTGAFRLHHRAATGRPRPSVKF
nr:uncharacterized protein LOC120969108 [Aegilops tauschii subsp. strangulata]